VSNITLNALDFDSIELEQLDSLAKKNNLSVEQVLGRLMSQFIAEQKQDIYTDLTEGLIAYPSIKIGPKSTTLELPVACRRVVH